MRRIPVAATIREAYVFAATHLGGVIGLIWIPMVLLTVMGFFSFQRYYNDFIDAVAGGNAAELGPSLLMMFGYLIAALLLQAMMYVSVMQLALGQRGTNVVAHFAFGTQEWRMFRAFFGFAALILALIIPAFALANALLTGLGARLSATAATVLLLAILYAVVLAAMPRFLALLPAVAVAETTPVLKRAWMLSAGNFWRLLAVLIGIFGPIFLLFTILEIALSGQAPIARGATEQVQLLAGVVRARQALPLISGLAFLISPLVVGLFAGASASAWRTLNEKTASCDIVA